MMWHKKYKDLEQVYVYIEVGKREALKRQHNFNVFIIFLE